MSHFSVLVIGENVEEQLAPYQENNVGDCPSEYMEFKDEEDQYFKEYLTDSASMVRLDNGEWVYSWDDRFYVGDLFDKKKVIPEHLEQREVPHKEKYPTIEEFMEGWAGYKKRDDKMNRYGHWENPNAKWDWWEIGGRWNNFFLLKNGGRSNSDIKSEIDFDGMDKELLNRKMKEYQLFYKTVNRRPVPIWKDILEKYDKDVEGAREEYRSNPVIKDLDSLPDRPFAFTNFQEYLVDELTFKTRQIQTTFAVVKDGQWYERGEMGWWGCVTSKKDVDKWNEEWKNLINSLPNNELLTIVDCHI